MKDINVQNLPERVVSRAVVKGDAYAEETAKVADESEEALAEVGDLIDEKLLPLLRIIYPKPDKTLVVALASLAAGIDFANDLYTDNTESLKQLFSAVVDKLNSKRPEVLEAVEAAEQIKQLFAQAEAQHYANLAKEGVIGNA